MINRKILYGYQIQNGEITVVEDEALVVRRVFSLYLGGLSYQRISDTLNGEEIPFCREAPLWNKHKVKRLLKPFDLIRHNKVAYVADILLAFWQNCRKNVKIFDFFACFHVILIKI